MAKKTPWFDGSVKPVRDGVYEVVGIPYTVIGSAGAGRVHVSFTRRGRYAGWRHPMSGPMCVDRWRGLAEEPKS